LYLVTLLATSHFYANNCPFKGNGFTGSWTTNCLKAWYYVRNKPTTEPVTLKICNIKLSFNIWLVLYMYFILYSWYYTSWFSSQRTTEYLGILNTKTKTIQVLKETGNYFEYIQVLGNRVQSSMEIIRNYVISNRVIKYKKEPGSSILEKNK